MSKPLNDRIAGMAMIVVMVMVIVLVLILVFHTEPPKDGCSTGFILAPKPSTIRVTRCAWLLSKAGISYNDCVPFSAIFDERNLPLVWIC
jgi:hypothetical protein